MIVKERTNEASDGSSTSSSSSIKQKDIGRASGRPMQNCVRICEVVVVVVPL